MNDTKTPRTDAAESNWWSEDGMRSAFIVRADFARELEREIERLREERDEARQRLCKVVGDNRDMWGEDVAKEYGWDCFKGADDGSR